MALRRNKRTKKRRATKKKRKIEYSKIITLIVVILGFSIAQECLLLMWYCIKHDFTATAAWLTAAVGLAETVIGTGLAGYLGLAKSDHTEGGITFEAAKANGFLNKDGDRWQSPPI